MKEKKSKYFTIKDFAKMKNVSRQTIYNWIESQKLQENKDYIILSDGSYTIILNEKTKKLKASR